MITGNKVRIAQTMLTCDICKEPILPGHEYKWLHIKKGRATYLKRAHPKCREATNVK